MAEEFIKLTLEQKAGSRDKYLVALRATADHYGWLEQFPIWTPQGTTASDGKVFFLAPSRRGELRCQGSITLRVSESPSKHSYAKGLVHRFKLSWNCGLVDIAEVAHFTQGDWHWMTDPKGQRIDRARWEARYQTSSLRKRGGLVSA